MTHIIIDFPLEIPHEFFYFIIFGSIMGLIACIGNLIIIWGNPIKTYFPKFGFINGSIEGFKIK